MSINDAVELLSSEKLKDRADGLNQLQDVLNSSVAMSKANDKVCYRLVEAIFCTIDRDRALYLNKQPAALEQRLFSAADALRRLLSEKVTMIKSKTIRLVINSIKKYMTINSTESLCKPLVVPLCKVCLVICSYTPHVEHLPLTDWDMLIRFCCKVMRTSITMNSNAPSRISTATTDILNCIYCLMSCRTVSYSSSISSDLYSDLHHFLRTFQSETSGHFYAFATVNILLTMLITRDLEQVSRIVVETLDYVSPLVNCKDIALRGQILMFLVLSNDPLNNFLHKCSSDIGDGTSTKSSDAARTTSQEGSKSLEKKLYKVLELLLPSSSIKIEDVSFCLTPEPDDWYNFRWVKKSHQESKDHSWLSAVASYRILKLYSKFYSSVSGK